MNLNWDKYDEMAKSEYEKAIQVMNKMEKKEIKNMNNSVVKIYLFDFRFYDLRKGTLKALWSISPDDLFDYDLGKATAYCRENVKKGHCRDFHIVTGQE